MFSEFGSIRGSIWKSKVNSFLGIIFLGTCALWSAMLIWNASSGKDPLTTAFAAVIVRETQLP